MLKVWLSLIFNVSSIKSKDENVPCMHWSNLWICKWVLNAPTPYVPKHRHFNCRSYHFQFPVYVNILVEVKVDL